MTKRFAALVLATALFAAGCDLLSGQDDAARDGDGMETLHKLVISHADTSDGGGGGTGSSNGPPPKP